MDQVLGIFEEVYPRWKILLKEEQRKEDRVYESGEGAYLRRFSPAWVYTRIIHKATYVLGRFKMHEREHAVTADLLNQHLFHAARRGAWYTRKALLEEHYMFALQPPSGVSDIEQQKRYWKRKSLKTCEKGLQDKDCHVIYHYDLQKRIRKIEKQLKIPKREQHDFDHVLLSKPVEVTVKGVQIKKEYPPQRRRSNTVGGSEEKQRSTKTIWVDELEDGGECSVEEMCLSWYRSQGMKGYHAEGGIIRTLFAYLFYDILFIYIPNVFQTAYQTCPLDLHTDAFFPSRGSEINHRLVEIANGDAERLIREVDARSRENKTCVIGLKWDFELDDLVEIVRCFDGAALATICKVMAQEYRVRGGGIPDLFLWDPAKKKVLFSEVKSENDRLSDTQRLWIHVLTGAGVRVELCNAVAREVRIVQVEG
jgi:Fanconi-associated nuclease 1